MRSCSCSSFGVVLLLAVLGCRPASPDPRTTTPEPETSEPTDEHGSPREADEFGPPSRWQIDGSTMAGDSSLPVELDRALRDHGRLREDVQDHIVVDINDDGRLDAIVVLPAPAVSGAYDFLVLLSNGNGARVHVLGELVEGSIFAVAVLPLVDGPTLIAAGPRLGSCERGPSWTFLRPTGDLLESVGRIGVEPYDCSVAEAKIVFERGPDGRVLSIEQRHGDATTHWRWDAALGNFAEVSPPDPD